MVFILVSLVICVHYTQAPLIEPRGIETPKFDITVPALFCPRGYFIDSDILDQNELFSKGRALSICSFVYAHKMLER